jgi:glutamyl-tRNA reductase
VGQVDNVYLYNVDDLEQVVNENLEARRKEIDQAMELVEKAVDQFMHWWHGLAAEPTIVSMSEEFDQIRERELRKTLAALPDLNDGQREEIAYLTKRIVRSILQRPMSGIKNEIAHHDPHTVIHLVKRLFGISETP